jgi:hypothetical protein
VQQLLFEFLNIDNIMPIGKKQVMQPNAMNDFVSGCPAIYLKTLIF